MSTDNDHTEAIVRAALAEDPRTNALDVQVVGGDGRIVMRGRVASAARHALLEQVARETVPPGVHVENRVEVVDYPPHLHEAGIDGVRIAAVGDLHVGADGAGRLRHRIEPAEEQADLLLLAGDLTQHGTEEEGRVLADELEGLRLPVVAVLGNHDYHAGAERQIRAALELAGVTVLEGEMTELRVRGRRVVIGGAKGFGSGFAGACGSDFGEPEMKAFVRHAKAQAARLGEALLGGNGAELRIALTHYSPVADTLAGEPREIYPFLGSYHLAEAIDEARCDLAVHGHAHRGSEHGVTAGGVPVRNVALPVIREAFRIYRIGGGASVDVATAAS